jgi:hypothetical protein
LFDFETFANIERTFFRCNIFDFKSNKESSHKV